MQPSLVGLGEIDAGRWWHTLINVYRCEHHSPSSYPHNYSASEYIIQLIISTLYMSLYCLAGFDLPTVQVLSMQLHAFRYTPITQSNSSHSSSSSHSSHAKHLPKEPLPTCSLCKKAKKQQLLILINHHIIEAPFDDLVLLCAHCRKSDQMKDQPTAHRKTILAAVNAVLEQQFCKQATPTLSKLLQSIRKARPSRKYIPQDLIKEVNEKLMGWTEEESDTAECEGRPRRTCQLLLDFYSDLKRSDIAMYYRSLFNQQMQLQSTLISFIHIFCKRQRIFKLDVLSRLQHLISQTRDPKDVFKWVRKGLEGMQYFSIAFAATKRNLQHTLYSVCRTAIQYRYVYDEENTDSECELLVTEFPLSQRPTLMRVTSFGFEDEVEIGIFFAKRNLAEGNLAGCLPLLYRFRVGFPKVKKRAVTVEGCRRRLDRNSKSYSESKIVDKQETKGRKRRPVFSLEDEDELQLVVDYTKEMLRIINRTQQTQVYQTQIKAGYTAKYFIFPCVRLIGTRIMVENLIE